MRHLLAALVAAVAVFLWGFLAWAAVGIWDFAFPRAANETAIVEVLRSSLDADGTYVLPMMPDGYGESTSDEAKQAEFAAFEERHRAGPIAMVMYRASGSEVMPPMELMRGFAIEFVGALLFACVLSAVDGGFSRRATVGFTIALFASTVCYGVMGNFMRMPFDFVLAFWLDAIIAWTLAAVVIARMLPRRAAAAAA